MTRTRNAVRARIAVQRAECLPLEEFPADMRAEIEAEIAAPAPPDQWFPVGAPRSMRPLAWMPSRGWYAWHWARDIDPEGGRGGIPALVRAAVLKRDGYVCQLCFDYVKPADVHLDHIAPYSHGGPDTVGNLRSRCNMRRGARA